MNADSTAITLGAARAKRWRRTSLWAVLALCLLALWGALALIHGVSTAPLQLSVNGESLVTDLDLAALEPLHEVALVIGLAVVLLVVLMVAFGGVLLTLVALVPIVLLSVALPVFVVGVLLLVLLSPLWLLAWLLWRAVRPAPRSPTMAA